MTTKSEIREETADLVAEFIKNGGKIVTVATVKQRKVKHPATGHQKLYFGWREPKGRPAVMWDGIETKL
jgi:hypothetical protein